MTKRVNELLPGTVVSHFKRGFLKKAELAAEPNMYLYEIIGVAQETESGEQLMIYRALYGNTGMYARPLDMFLSTVDKAKYPNSVQKYRFEKIG